MNYIKKLSGVLVLVGAHYCVLADTIINYDYGTTAKTKYGAININHDSESGDLLYFNNKLINISQNDDFYSLSILSKIEKSNSVILLIWGGAGGTIDANTNIHCKFLTLLNDNRYRVSKITYCPTNKTVRLESGLIKYDFLNPLPYALNNDIGTLGFYGKEVKIIKDVHDQNYYKSYYAKFTPHQIYAMVAKDNSNNALVTITSIRNDKSWCHACGTYGVRYCEPFNWIVNPIHDKYYNLLKPICSSPIYQNIVNDQLYHL